MATTEIDETVKRIVAHKGVQQLVIMDYAGIPIRVYPPTMEHTEAVRFAAAATNLHPGFRSMIRDLDTTNDLTHIRLRSKKNELLIYPEKEYLVVLTQASNACSL
jgi:dynein light chain roadblock-type